jgi:uncharacterized lipoprotein YmbA
VKPAIVVACLVVAGCGSTPEPTYYALAPTSGAAHAAAPHVIKVLTPAIAGYLDRSEIVRRVQGYRLSLTHGDSWAEPLASMIGRVVALDLSERFPNSIVFTDDGTADADPDALVSLDVLRFDEGSDGTLVLVTDVCVQRGGDRNSTAVRTLRFAQKPRSGATGDIVSAMSELVGLLSDAVAGLMTRAT